MQNLTTCLMVSSPDVRGPFTQSQWRPTATIKKDWLWSYLIPKPKCLDAAGMHLIVNSIRTLFPDAKDLVEESAAPFPSIARPRENKSYVLQTPAISENEGEISGVYRVHDKLFKRILEFKEYAERLVIIYGNHMTTAHMRSIIAAQLEAKDDYNRKQWMLPVPAFFHIKLNFIEMIFRVFWDSFVSEDVQFLGRSQHISRQKVKYHHALPLLQDAFRSRILAFLIRELVDDGVLLDKDISRKTVESALEGLGSTAIEEKLAGIHQQLLSPAGWTGLYEGQDYIDLDFRSQCRYLQTVRVLLVMVTAVHLGDYGVLRQLIPTLPTWFYGGGSSKYGPEMLYFAWLLHPEVTDSELSEGILRSGLVRCTTAGSQWKAIDLALEHVNAAFAIDIKNNKNSTHDVTSTFLRLAVVGPYTAAIRKGVERIFRTHQDGKHTNPATNGDCIDYACLIYRNGRTRRRQSGTPAHEPVDIRDIQREGMRLIINEKRDWFNSTVVRPAYPADYIALPGLADEDDVIVESEEGDRLYGADDDLVESDYF